jgi:phosphatidylglycerol:prolipoprotein diacylglycerol transferase
MYPYLRIGPLLLQTPGLAVLLGVWLASQASEKEAARLKLRSSEIYNLLFLGLVVGLAGARLAYAARYWNAFAESPLSLFSLNTSTLSWFEGFIFGVLAAWIYASRKQIPLRPLLDALAPGLAVFMVSLGFAHILSGSAYGSVTDVPWSVYLWSDYRHPTQIYETLLALAVLALTWLRPFGKPGAGLNFLTVVALSSLSRIFLERFRGDSDLVAGGLRQAQVGGLVVLAVCLFLLYRWYDQPYSKPEPHIPDPENGKSEPLSF